VVGAGGEGFLNLLASVGFNDDRRFGIKSAGRITGWDCSTP
jgi:hypothetical protein